MYLHSANDFQLKVLMLDIDSNMELEARSISIVNNIVGMIHM